ncbi:MAG: hypothetical protein A3F11_03715 [Gammaproteobacteria bacterium RIFCSPHIGHO2_12_FULL_37_14]|nr:MAG: hypothetical protein A3F11_03715 [Gammaproteobacteria bacterium RIFCSPHIGHO2_12_FULL_37_14]
MIKYFRKIVELTKAGLLYFILSFILICIIPIWVLKLSYELKKIPSNFEYTADIFSLDNFYNEKLKRFEGERISKTYFKYRVIEKTATYLAIEVTFDVKELNETPIFSVTRLYYINPYTHQHISMNNLKNRNGFLFAPMYSDKSNYIYWHVNYDAPATLKFVKSEKINGLKVYKYHAYYEADQTENLSYLPDVPEKRGIHTTINLTLWIEPISGWLIKYEDSTLAYYYNRMTGQYIEPWNKFSNRYTQTSIVNNVNYAFVLKWKFIIIDYIVPIILLFLAFVFFWFGYKKANWRFVKPSIILFFKKVEKVTISGLIIILLIIAIAEFAYYLSVYKKKQLHYKIGISLWIHNNAYMNAIKGFKDGLAEYGINNNENVTFYIESSNADVEKQINIIQLFINKKFDLIYTLGTPGSLIAKGITKNIPIVFSFVAYPVEVNLIDSLRSSKTNLVGSRNYIPASQQFYYFEQLYPNVKKLGFVRHKGNESSEIQLKEYQQLFSKRHVQLIDIAVVDEDHLSQLLQSPLGYDSLYLACDTFMQGNAGRIAVDISRKNKIPTFTCNMENVIDGALIGYVADPYIIGKIAGRKAALILRGADPQWLYSESPKQGYLIINRTTAKLLGIDIPEAILQKSDYIIGK